MSAKTHLAWLLIGSLAVPAGCGDDPEPGPCESVDCGSHGTCMQQGSDAVCVCLEGYRPDGLSCVPVEDPCEGVDCSGHGSCVVLDTGTACYCDEGYRPEGLDCVPDVDPCEGIECSGQGACTVVEDTPVCACLTGYQPVGLSCLPEWEMVPMRDGVELWTRLYLPPEVPAEGVAAILWRTPYRDPGRLDFMEDIGPVFTARGYAYLVQDCRGRGLSEGEFYPMRHAFEDGRDTTDWMVSQPWSNGRIGLMGCSYPGFAALAAAVDNPNVYVVIADDPPEDPTWFTVNGLFKSGAAIAYHQTLDYLAGLEVSVTNPNDRLDLLGLDQLVLGRTVLVWQDWVTRENPQDPYWDDMRLAGHYQDICAPVLSLWSNEPWNDPRHVWQGLDQEGCPFVRNQHRLVATAEGHCFHVATLLESKPTRTGRLMLDYIDKFLGERDVDLSDVARVQFRPAGAWDYTGVSDWPPTDREIEFFLHMSDQGSGSLLTEAQPGAPTMLDIDPQSMGVCDEEYPVAWYFSEPLDLPTFMVGEPAVVLYASASTVDASFSGVLYEYLPDSMQYNVVAQGRLRAHYRKGYNDPAPLDPDQMVVMTIPLWGSAAHVFSRHSQIVLMLTGSRCFMAENPHTGESLAEQSEWLPSTYRIFHAEQSYSRLVMPILFTGY